MKYKFLLLLLIDLIIIEYCESAIVEPAEPTLPLNDWEKYKKKLTIAPKISAENGSIIKIDFAEAFKIDDFTKIKEIEVWRRVKTGNGVFDFRNPRIGYASKDIKDISIRGYIDKEVNQPLVKKQTYENLEYLTGPLQ